MHPYSPNISETTARIDMKICRASQNTQGYRLVYFLINRSSNGKIVNFPLFAMLCALKFQTFYLKFLFSVEHIVACSQFDKHAKFERDMSTVLS